VPKWNVDSEGFSRGVELFNRAAFFEAHEVLEDVWRAAAPPQKKFLQGLIQVAVALHHHSRGNVAGARSLLGRAVRNLEGCPADFCGLQMTALRHAIAEWGRALAENKPVPRLPKL
jgi:uncharacterized protein